MKKSLLIILCTLMSLMSWAQNRADGTAEPYAVLKGDTLLTFYYDDQKATRNGMDIGPFSSATARGWHSARETITSVVFDDSFANYDALTSMNMWFYNLTHLTSVTGISNLNTANVTSFRSTFSGCSSLTSLDLSSLNTSKVMEMNFMFEGCSSLTDLKVGFSTESVTTMANMFLGCSSLTTLDLSTFNTSSVKSSMDYMFSSCSALTTIYVSDLWTTTNVTTGNEMFNACQNLVGGQGTSFSASHRGLDYAHIDGGENNPGYFTDKNAAGTFDIRVSVYGNGEVSVGNLPDVIVDGKSAVASVDAGGSLEMFFFPGEGYQLDSLMVDGINVTADVVPATGQSAASYTLNNINAVHNVITYFGEKASYNEAYAVLVSEDGGNIMYATLYYDGNKANHTEGFAVVGLDEMLQNQAWMMNRGSIQTVTFDESFANCNPTSTAYWFAFCNSLTAINGLQYLNTEYVTNMEYMFHMCPALTSIDLSHFRAKSLTNMNSMFGGCSSLTSLDLSGFFTFTVTNMNYLFSGCTNLKTIYVNKYDWSTESVTSGDGVFENCTSLVGGAGTTFNDSHIDYTYARIDGGPNSTTPGYFTDIDASASVVAPEFRFEGDNLAMTTETQNASIFYKVAELPSMAEAVVDSVRNSLIVTPDGQQSTYYEHPFELKINAVVKAIAVADNATGTIVSDTTTMVYDYEAWVNLKAAVESGTELYGRAQGNPNVDTQLLEQLQWALNEGDMIYNQRAQMDSFEATHFTQRINELCAQIEAQMAEDEPYAVLSDNDTVLTFYYDKQKTARGGIDINTRSWDIENGETPPYGGITKAVFDASFANYRPTSTDYWFQGCRNMTTVEGMENLNTSNVTSMWAMFDWCGSLESIDLSHMVTSNAVYLAYMFNGCSSLRSLDVSGFSTEKATDIGAMFRYCSKLTTVDVSHFNTSKVTSFWGLFAECSSLTSLDVSNFNTGQAENMAYMFYDCNQLQSLNVSNFNTSNVTDMLGMFGGCSSLTSLDLSSFNTQNVTNMAAMFYGCSGLTSLNLSGFNTSNVTDMQNMFSGRDMYSACRSLTSLDLSSFNTEKVTDMHDMFSSCSNLTTLDLTNFTTPKVRDFTNMFIGCEALETIYCENNWDSSSLDDQGTSNNMFYGLTKLKGGAGTTYSDEHTGPEYARVDGGPNSTTPGYFTDKNAPITVAAPEFRFEGDNLAMTTETQNASIFYKVAELPSMAEAVVDSVKNSLVVTPDGQQSTYYEHPFELKKNAVVKAIAVTDNATGTIVSDTTTMVYDYEAWVNLKAAVESGTELYGRAQGNPNVDTQLLEQLQWALNEGDMIYNNRAQMDSFEATHFTQRINELCAQIEAQMAEDEPYAVLSDNNTVLTFYYDKQKSVNNGMSVNTFTFSGYKEWHEAAGTIITAKFDSSFAGYTELANANEWFLDCSNLTTIVGIENFRLDNVTSMIHMFNGCSSLTNLELSHFNTENVTSMATMFSGCSSLTSIDLRGFNTLKVTDMMRMFSGCTNLKTVYVGDGWTTSAVTDSENMFLDCTSLVGGAGTHYDTNHVDVAYAHIDEGASNPGYFTRSGDSPWVDPTEKVETPYFRMESDYNNEVMIQTDTDEAEIFYTQNSRMIQGNDTDFGFGDWNLNWKVSGSNSSYQVTSGGYNNSYCLKLTSATASTFGSAQAGYKFVSALTKDTYYTLRFKARSESGRGQLQVFCQNDTIDNTRSTVDTLAIGSELADYEVTFKIQNEITNQVVLNFGAVADTYYIDNVLFGAVVSDTTNQKRTRYEQPINLREGATIKAVATKQGMLDSSPAVLDYFYDGWMNLRDVYEMAKAITYDCYGDPNVPLQMIKEVELWVDERYSRLWDRRGREHVDDTELLETDEDMRFILDELYRMKSGFTVDGVSYHAVDSTQVEVIPSLEGYYRGAITVPATVHYNDIDFRVTTVTQNAFHSEYLTAIIWNAGFALTATDLQSSQNPNLLLYVTEASMAPTDRDNVVINGFAKNIRLSEGGDFYCPQAFTAEAISYTREFKQQTQIGVSRGWETIALPFTVQTITHEQRGVIAPFGNTASNTHFWLRQLTENGLQGAQAIEANRAYLISMPNSEEYPAEFNLAGRVTFSAENATVPVTEPVSVETPDYTLIPAFQCVYLGHSAYALNVGAEYEGHPEGSVFVYNYREVRPFEAYTLHTNNSQPAPPYFIVGDMGGDTTGIDATLVNSERVNSEAWYTLDGRKLQGKPTQKGVYITNGKKVIIK